MEQTIEILNTGQVGYLAVLGDDLYPYAVPVNYVFYEGCIWIHCAFEGHKIDAITHHSKVSFSVVEHHEVVEETFTTLYQSAIVFGKAKLIGPNKIVLQKLIEKYASSYLDEGMKYIDKDYSKTQIIQIEIEHLSGKSKY